MKIKVLILISFVMLAFMDTGFADLSEHGIFVGYQFGYVDTHNIHTENLWTDFVPFLSKAGSRMFAGYRFNDYLSAEVGYNAIVDGKTDGGLDYRIRGFDVIGKAILPLRFGFSLFGLGGGSYVQQDINNKGLIPYKSDENKILPVFGAGAGFNFTESIAVEVSWMHTQGFGEIRNIDMYTLGFSYTF